MTRDSLTPLQKRLLRTLSPLEPPWTLTGGGALALHLGHRTTRDLDLFWRARTLVGTVAAGAEALLRADGFEVAVLRRSPQFVEFRVSDRDDVCIVDLVAEPFAAVDRPQRMDVGGTTVQVDSIQEILVAKLAALLGRTELRDLIDVGAILETGADLAAAVRDAPKKDAGFSVLTLAWVLESFETEPLALASGATEEEANRLEALRKGLVEQLTRLGRPE